MNIVLHLLNIIQHQSEQIAFLLKFIRKFIPISQWVHDDSKSPKYQKFKIDKLPLIIPFFKQDWKFLIAYFEHKYGKKIDPVRHRGGRSVPEDKICPVCGAPHEYLYDNNGGRGQYQCKVCGTTFIDGSIHSKPIRYKCPYCGHVLVPVKNRSCFRVHKCVNNKCSYYRQNLKKVSREHSLEKYRYKLHYIYREFDINFFKMDLTSLPKNTSSLNFSKYNANVMSLCLTLHVNLQLSLRKTAQAMNDLYGIRISHQQVANYARVAALVIKPFVDTYDYGASPNMVGDETYIKVKGVKGFVWFVMDAASRSILGYRVSSDRGVGACILAMRMALQHFRKLPEKFRFVADGYSAYPLAAQQFYLNYGKDFDFDITQVIGLTNEDAVSKEFRPFKQIVERMNRTFKLSYRGTCGYDNFDGANYSVALWVAYYNFLRPHKHNGYRVLNDLDQLAGADNMPAKWQILILLGQDAILRMQQPPSA